MNLKSLGIILCCMGFSFVYIHAQEARFYMPSEIQQAYAKGTRSFDGMPGENYWQNTVDYSMDVTIIPEERKIDGTVEIVYHNNSPDELNKLVVRLYQDVYKKGNPRAYSLNAKDLHDGVMLENVTIDGIEFDMENRQQVRQYGTNVSFRLEEPLRPGETLTFKASWEQLVPAHSRIRTGAYDSTTMFIAYWYPQVSVYDDIFGWDELNFSLQTEFYNNLGNYDVRISAPDDFIVLATGTLVNAKEVLPSKMFDRYEKAKTSEEKVAIVSFEEAEAHISLSSTTWHYNASEVSDFALAISDHYRWDAAMLPLDDGRHVLINAFYPADESRDYSKLVEIQQKTMKHFSEDIPGIPYPYEAFTTFNANRGGGMEYPMMANNGGPGRGVTIHEMFHTYLPMYVRTNERIWAWMDEGWAVYNTAVVSNRFFDDDFSFSALLAESSRAGMSGTFADLPLITSSDYMTDNYGYHAYSKAGLLYTILHHYLGDELFLKCYRAYITRWAKKSPSPYDFFYTFEDISGEDLGWLWKPWFFEFGASDLAITSFEKGDLIISNIGLMPMPIFLEVNYQNGDTLHVIKNAGVWKDGSQDVIIEIPDYAQVNKISLNKTIVDANLHDNFYPSIHTLYGTVGKLEEYTGAYRTSPGGYRIEIYTEDGMLFLRIPAGRMNTLLFPVKDHVFKNLAETMEITFNIDESATCTGLDLDWYQLLHADKLDQ